MVADIALISWVIIGTVLFAFIKPTRAMMLVYVIGILALPQEFGPHGVIALSASIRLDKLTSCNLAALLGTLIFAPQRLRNYRFNWLDVALLGLVVVAFASSVVNGVGVQDGVSQAITLVRLTYPVLIMAKVHLTTLPDLHIALRTIIGGAVCYVLVGVGEFRLSPQLHRLVYGYFQHSFDQFMRWGHFRPVGMLRHAIEYASFMTLSTLATYWLTLRGQFAPLWGWLKGWVAVCALLVGVAVTMTFSGYAILVIGMVLLTALHWTKFRPILLILPLVVTSYMVGRYFNLFDPEFLVRSTEIVNVKRGDSLLYRIQAEKANLVRCRNAPLLGQSPMLALRAHGDEAGLSHADDAYWLILLSFWGWAGLGLWMAIWMGGIVVVWWHWPSMPPEVRTVGGLIAIMIGLHLTDFIFNAFPSDFILLLDLGMITTASFALRRARGEQKAAKRRQMSLAMEGIA